MVKTVFTPRYLAVAIVCVTSCLSVSWATENPVTRTLVAVTQNQTELGSASTALTQPVLAQNFLAANNTSSKKTSSRSSEKIAWDVKDVPHTPLDTQVSSLVPTKAGFLIDEDLSYSVCPTPEQIQRFIDIKHLKPNETLGCSRVIVQYLSGEDRKKLLTPVIRDYIRKFYDVFAGSNTQPEVTYEDLATLRYRAQGFAEELLKYPWRFYSDSHEFNLFKINYVFTLDRIGNYLYEAILENNTGKNLECEKQLILLEDGEFINNYNFNTDFSSTAQATQLVKYAARQLYNLALDIDMESGVYSLDGITFYSNYVKHSCNYQTITVKYEDVYNLLSVKGRNKVSKYYQPDTL